MKLTRKKLMENAGIKRTVRESVTVSNSGESMTVKQMADLFAKISAELKGLPEQDAEFYMELGEIGAYGEGAQPLLKVRYNVDKGEKEPEMMGTVTFLVAYN